MEAVISVPHLLGPVILATYTAEIIILAYSFGLKMFWLAALSGLGFLALFWKYRHKSMLITMVLSLAVFMFLSGTLAILLNYLLLN